VFGLGAEMPPARVEHDRARVERPRKVLYIEDNPVNVLLMEAMLARVADLQVRAAALPTLGLRLAIEEPPDLILLDIQLPEMDGYEVLRRLRLHDASRDIPVIAVSANAMPGDIAHGLAAGFVEYLTKPLDMQKLIAAVEHALASG
jgi:CheY-like chemotaxis protein